MRPSFIPSCWPEAALLSVGLSLPPPLLSGGGGGDKPTDGRAAAGQQDGMGDRRTHRQMYSKTAEGYQPTFVFYVIANPTNQHHSGGGRQMDAHTY